MSIAVPRLLVGWENSGRTILDASHTGHNAKSLL